jgi:hypothetical protein
MTVCPAAKAASVIARPRKMVPPMSAIFNVEDFRFVYVMR